MRVRPGDVGKYVLLPGDPDRVLRIAKYLDDAREITFHREYRTCTGTYKGIPISATSTGIGCPSAAIAVEELANVGATHFIRVGSTGALQPGIKIGDLIVSTGSMRNEGTSRFYAAFDPIAPFDPNHAGSREQHAIHELQDRALPCAAPSDEDHHLAAIDREREAADARTAVRILESDVVELDDWRRVHGARRSERDISTPRICRRGSSTASAPPVRQTR